MCFFLRVCVFAAIFGIVKAMAALNSPDQDCETRSLNYADFQQSPYFQFEPNAVSVPESEHSTGIAGPITQTEQNSNHSLDSESQIPTESPTVDDGDPDVDLYKYTEYPEDGPDELKTYFFKKGTNHRGFWLKSKDKKSRSVTYKV